MSDKSWIGTKVFYSLLPEQSPEMVIIEEIEHEAESHVRVLWFDKNQAIHFATFRVVHLRVSATSRPLNEAIKLGTE